MIPKFLTRKTISSNNISNTIFYVFQYNYHNKGYPYSYVNFKNLSLRNTNLVFYQCT